MFSLPAMGGLPLSAAAHGYKCSVLSGEAADVMEPVVQGLKKRLPDLLPVPKTFLTVTRLDFCTELSHSAPLLRNSIPANEGNGQRNVYHRHSSFV